MRAAQAVRKFTTLAAARHDHSRPQGLPQRHFRCRCCLSSGKDDQDHLRRNQGAPSSSAPEGLGRWQQLEKAWDGPIEGLVVTRYGYGATCQRIEIIEAAHPCRMPPGLKPRGGC